MEDTIILNTMPRMTEKEKRLQSGESLKILPSTDIIQGSPRSRYIDTPMPPSFECSSPEKNGRTDFFRFEPVSPNRGKKRYSSTDRRNKSAKDGSRSVGSPRTGLRERRPKTSLRRTPKEGRRSSVTEIEDVSGSPTDFDELSICSETKVRSEQVDTDGEHDMTTGSEKDWSTNATVQTGDSNNCAPKDVMYSSKPDTDKASDDVMRKSRERDENDSIDDLGILDLDTLENEFEDIARHEALIDMYREAETILTQMKEFMKTAPFDLILQEKEIDLYVQDYYNRRPQVEFVNKKFGEVNFDYDNFNTEATRLRVTHRERKISGMLLWNHNRELEGNIAELMQKITEVEERKDISLDEYKNEIKEKSAKIGEMNKEIKKIKPQLDEARKKLNLLKIDMTSKGLSVSVPGIAKSFDGSSPLPENLRVDLSPPLDIADMPYRSMSSLSDAPKNLRDRHALNPHEVLDSPSKAMSLLHWLRCCNQRFSRESGIPVPAFYLPHGTIRYSETYTVNIRKPTFLLHNRRYNRDHWLPSDLELTSLPYIPGIVPHKSICKQTMIQSRLYWLNCCSFPVPSNETPSTLLLERLNDDGDSMFSEGQITIDENAKTSHGPLSEVDNEEQSELKDNDTKKSKKKVIKSKIYTGLCAKTGKLPATNTLHVEYPNQSSKGRVALDKSVIDTKRSYHEEAVHEDGTKPPRIETKKSKKKVIKSKINTGLCSKTRKLPPTKSAPVVNASALQASVCNEKSAPTVSETSRKRKNFKNIKSKINTGLTPDSKRLPPISTRTVTSQDPTSRLTGLSRNAVLPPIKTGVSNKSTEISSKAGKTSAKAVMLPTKPNKRIVDSGSGTKAKNLAVKQQRKTTKVINKTQQTQPMPPKKAVAPKPSAVPDSKSRSARLAPLKHNKVIPGQVGSSVATRTSLTPLPAIRTSDTSVNKSPRKGQGLVRPSSSCNGFGYDIPRNDYY